MTRRVAYYFSEFVLISLLGTCASIAFMYPNIFSQACAEHYKTFQYENDEDKVMHYVLEGGRLATLLTSGYRRIEGQDEKLTTRSACIQHGRDARALFSLWTWCVTGLMFGAVIASLVMGQTDTFFIRGSLPAVMFTLVISVYICYYETPQLQTLSCVGHLREARAAIKDPFVILVDTWTGLLHKFDYNSQVSKEKCLAQLAHLVNTINHTTTLRYGIILIYSIVAVTTGYL